MEENNNQIINIDGKDYTEDQLTDNQKYFINFLISHFITVEGKYRDRTMKV